MKDKTDTRTLTLPIIPKGRGRPPTGKAKSATTRFAEQLARDFERARLGEFNEMTLTGLHIGMKNPDYAFDCWREIGLRRGFFQQ